MTIIAGLATACAALQTPKAEYHAGFLLYLSPKFSFQMPDGWRPATASDWTRFELNERPLVRLNEQGRRHFESQGRAEIERYPAVLISSKGAWIDVQVSPNRGAKYQKGYRLTDVERDALWHSLERALKEHAVATDKPTFRLISLDVNDCGNNTALAAVFWRTDLRGDWI
jgi:hypothetical protein